MNRFRTTISAKRGRAASGGLAALLLLRILLPIEGQAAVLYDKQISGREVVIIAPDRHTGAIPLVVALHGCSQSAMEFLDASGLEALVDREPLVLALPQARATGDNPLGCWDWWDPGNQRRDGPDPRHIVEITRSMDVRVDPRRVYALGFSSGGAMAAILGAVYPDVFAAIGVHSGLVFAAAANATCALKAMRRGPPEPDRLGELAYLHQTVHRIVPTIIIQGGADEVVDPVNSQAMVREIANSFDFIDDGDGDNDSFDDEADGVTTGTGPCGAANGAQCYAYREERFEDREGTTVMEHILVDDLGHAWSGGENGQRYADSRGPRAGDRFWSFFENRVLESGTLVPAPPVDCREWWAPPWWHYTWAGTMSFSEYACDMNPWSMVWRHKINGVPGPGRCP